MLFEEMDRNTEGEFPIDTGNAQVDPFEQSVDLEQLSDLEVADILLRENIEHGSRRHLIVIFSLEENPGINLVYATSDNTRSMQIVGEEEAFARVGFYEDLAKQYPPASCESHLINIADRREFIPLAKQAVQETGTHEGNTRYLLGVLDSLSEI